MKKRLSMLLAFTMIFTMCVSQTTMSFAETVPYSGIDISTGHSFPVNVIMGPDEKLYVSEYSGNKIIKMDKDGQNKSTFATGFSQPIGMVFDNAGNLYVAEHNGSKVTKVNTSGVTSLVKSIGGGYLTGIVIDSNDKLFTLDYTAGKIYKMDVDGNNYSTFLSGLPTTSLIGMCIDENDNIYITDRTSGKILKVEPNAALTDFATGLTNIQGITLGEDGYFYATTSSRLIEKINSNGEKIKTFSTGTINPWGLTVDSGGYIYFGESSSTVRVILGSAETQDTKTIKLNLNKEIVGTEADPESFTISGVFSNPDVTSAVISGSNITLTLSSKMTSLDTNIKVSYKKTGTNDLVVSGSAVKFGEFNNLTVKNNIIRVLSAVAIPQINVENGTDISVVNLPNSVTLNLSNATTTTAAVVSWDIGTPAYNGNVAGAYTFSGEFDLEDNVSNPNNIKAYVSVVVNTTSASQHIISFESNGGSVVPSQTVNDGEKAIRPSDPTKTGNSFSGWYKESSIINEFDFNTQVTTSATLYAKWIGNSSGGGGSSSSPDTPSTPPTNQNTNVIINGESFSVGKEEKRDLGNGKTETKVTVEKEAVLKQIEAKASSGGNNTIEIRGNVGENGALRIGLTGDIVKAMEDKSFDLSIKKDNVDYRIPAKEMTIDKVAQELGLSGSELQKIEVEVIISPVSDELKKSIDEVSKTLNNTQFIVKPMNFEIKAKATSVDGKTMETNISTFNQYVERVMEIPNGVDPSKITTGIVFNEDGTFQHVPTVVYQENGKWYARINSRSNSSYSVVYNPIEVDAVKNHWAKESVNNMASRMVITEIEGFNPNEAITRGEFADYITRGLGIYKSNEQTNSKFSDVSGTKFEKSIIIAHKYGIISGYENNTFKPESKITREEAMSMFVRAMEITELAKKEQQSLVKFEDAKKVSPWALDSVKTAISSKIFNGISAKKIEPKGIFTKAEAATAIQNLLIESKLINN